MFVWLFSMFLLFLSSLPLFCVSVLSARFPSASVSCLANQFRCSSSGSCIPANQRCDGIVDCPDRDDEINCATSPPGFPFFYFLFLVFARWFDSVYFVVDVRPGFSVSTQMANIFIAWLTECTANQFQCRDRTLCIDSRRKCDSRVDCPDGSDEENCGKLSLFLASI